MSPPRPSQASEATTGPAAHHARRHRSRRSAAPGTRRTDEDHPRLTGLDHVVDRPRSAVMYGAISCCCTPPPAPFCATPALRSASALRETLLAAPIGGHHRPERLQVHDDISRAISLGHRADVVQRRPSAREQALGLGSSARAVGIARFTKAQSCTPKSLPRRGSGLKQYRTHHRGLSCLRLADSNPPTQLSSEDR
jgi:hypothetical protein